MEYDRFKEEPDCEAVDCVFPTLDCERYLCRTLDALYREVPVKTLFVCDGGSTDRTLELLQLYPRVVVSKHPELTHLVTMKFLLSRVTTAWCVFVDNAKVMQPGWYDMMMQHRDRGEMLNSKRIIHYEFERWDPTNTDRNVRAIGGPWLMKTDLVKNMKVDNRWNARLFDVILRQNVEEQGGRYGVVPEASHMLYLTEEERYRGNKTLRGTSLEFRLPELRIWNKPGWERRLEENVRGIVQYTRPSMVKDCFLDDHWMLLLCRLPQDWVGEVSSEWYEYIRDWKRHRFLKAWLRKMLYDQGRLLLKLINRVFEKMVESGSNDQIKGWRRVEKL